MKINGMIPLLQMQNKDFLVAADAALDEALEVLGELPNEEGKATIKLLVEIQYEKGILRIVPGIESKLPKETKFGGSMFWLADGNVSTEHPRQSDMFPRKVDEASQA